MKRFKKLRNCQDGNFLDRISSLPDDILGHMLSFLPTRHAVRTSILSARWRHLFALTTCLSFNDEISLGYTRKDENERIYASQRFKEFVDKVLGLHQISPIEKFSLLLGGIYDKTDLNRWVSNVLQKGVQELHYQLPLLTDCVPNGFFMCETLVRIHLEKVGSEYYEIEIPLSVRLPKLKILHLHKIAFLNFSSMDRLFSSCELLEELTLRYCCCETSGHTYQCIGILKVLRIEHCTFWLSRFEIDAPNLAYLTYSRNIGVKIVPSWKNSSSFKEAELNFRRLNEDLNKYDRELLKAAASKVTKLDFEKNLVELLIRLDDDEQMPEFHSLSSLHLGACSWKYVISLLDKSPQLKTVVFESGILCCCNSEGDCPDLCDCDSRPLVDIPLVPFSCHVDGIKVHEFCGDKGPMLLMGHLLRNASVLRSLIVYPVNNLSPEKKLKIRKELLKLPSASTDCCIEMIQSSACRRSGREESIIYSSF